MKVGVSFDFFGTLVEIDGDVPTIGEELTRRGYPCASRIEAIWNSEGFDGRQTHDPTIEPYGEWRRANIARLAQLCGAPPQEALDLAVELLRLDQDWTVKARQGACSLLELAHRLGASVCLLTNWDYDLGRYLEMAGLPCAINAVVSAEIGFRKPHVQAFRTAQAVLGVTPDRHIHVGDDWAADVVGAVQSGAWAMWITNRAQEALPPRIVQSSLASASSRLAELIRIVGVRHCGE